MSTQPEPDRIASVTPLPVTHTVGAQLAPPLEQTTRLKGLRGALERYAERPAKQPARPQVKWWATTGTEALGRLLLNLPYLAVVELRPVGRGFWRVATAWSAWCAATDYAAAAKAADGNDRAKHAERVEARKEGRRRLSLFVLLVLTGLVWWAAATAPGVLLLASLVLVCVLDAVGRRRKPDEPLPPAKRTVLTEGVPMRQLTASVCDILDREFGVVGAVGVHRPMTWDQARQEYRVDLSSEWLIEPKHLRAIERGIGAADYSTRLIGTDTATVRELVIRRGDPLAVVGKPAWVETGSRSIAEPVDIGESATDLPFAVPFAGVHVGVVAATGGGKTKSIIWAVIDRLSACRDAVLWGIDLGRGPALVMWRGVIQRAAYTEQQAIELLDAALAEIDRRMGVLTALAEDDDPDNDADEWHTGLGPALVLIIDEFALLAEWNGEKGKVDLLGRVERIIRTGRKVWVSLVPASQKAGNSDFGSTVMQTQVGVWIIGPCSERDTVTTLGTERRDRGWSPHLLQPAVEGDVRDAGKCYVLSPAHRTPDIYRAYAPLTPGEVKARARQRLADGLPRLDGHQVEELAVEVPAILAAVEVVFRAAGTPEFLPTRALLGALRDPDLDERRLAEQLEPCGVRPAEQRKRVAGSNPLRGYLWTDVEAALGRL